MSSSTTESDLILACFPILKEAISRLPEDKLYEDFRPLVKDWHKESCVVCLEEFAAGDKVKFAPCGHFQHKDCMKELFLSSSPPFRCPECRASMFDTDTSSNVAHEFQRVTDPEDDQPYDTVVLQADDVLTELSEALGLMMGFHADGSQLYERTTLDTSMPDSGISFSALRDAVSFRYFRNYFRISVPLAARYDDELSDDSSSETETEQSEGIMRSATISMEALPVRPTSSFVYPVSMQLSDTRHDDL